MFYTTDEFLGGYRDTTAGSTGFIHYDLASDTSNIYSQTTYDFNLGGIGFDASLNWYL